ncbi:MAG: hypothetical protein IJM90_04235 [Firmicutes bacterium]|nr:hypothetical protein [Bacillota bacterium]
MFGYINVNRQELKVKELARYRSFYCGLCRELARRYGFTGRLTLTYDMTFLIILLGSLYGLPASEEKKACPVHPLRKTSMTGNEATEYAADMNILLSYEHLVDDWRDERQVFSGAAGLFFRRHVKKLHTRYAHKSQVFAESLASLHLMEEQKETSLDLVSGCFGRLMGELFAWKHDQWEDRLRGLGDHLGRFIYLMDAYDDFDKDLKKGSYNVLHQWHDRSECAEMVKMLLVQEMAVCSEILEFLPLEEDVGILRNIIYGGVWTRWQAIEKKVTIKEEDHESGSV